MLKNPPYAVDFLLIDESLSSWINGRFKNTVLIKRENYRIELERENNKFVKRGEYSSRVIQTKFPVNEIVPSYNIFCPDKCGFSVRIRISRDNKIWSTWFYLGKWGEVEENEIKILANKWGKVNIDYLFLPEDKAINYIQYKITFFSKDGKNTPSMSLFAISYSNTTSDKKLYEQFYKKITLKMRDWQKRLPVPFRSQSVENKKYRWSVCSPTCVAMILEYNGIKRKTGEIIKKIYDEEYKIYGNWSHAVNTAVQYGLKGYLQRFRNWDEVKYQISQNQPVVASIKFKEGVLSNAPIPKSSGHIIVITGINDKGDIFVNDPAGKMKSTGMVVYKAKELAKAWFDHSGVGYIIKRSKMTKQSSIY